MMRSQFKTSSQSTNTYDFDYFRDIKPANFCIRCDLSGTRELKMIDFGLTKEATDGKALNGNVGTQRYSSINLMKGKVEFLSHCRCN